MTDILTVNAVIQLVKVEDKQVQVVTLGTQGPPGSGGGGGSSDHGALSGLEDDDHPQYHSDARGDVRYYTKPQADTQLGEKADSVHAHSIADVTALQTSLDGKAAASHAHSIADVTVLQASLDGKAAASHAHSITDVSGLQTSLDGKAAVPHAHSIPDVSGLQTSLDGKAAASHSHIIAEVTGLQTSLDSKAAATHIHGIADVSGLQTSLDGKLDNSVLALIPKTAQVTVDFGHAGGGESDITSVTVAAAWVTGSSVILCHAAGVATPDHDAEDAALEGISAVAANLNAGVGFDVIARAAGGGWGRYSINIMGV